MQLKPLRFSQLGDNQMLDSFTNDDLLLLFYVTWLILCIVGVYFMELWFPTDKG